ncbi:MAG: hypothetical protein Q9170_000313 [Blastenia crenularia]
MAAPHIPNLNTLRRGPPPLTGRARGVPSSSRDEADQLAKDKIVQQTDQDASVSRLSAVQIGYLDDPYARFFVSGDGQRRFPIINRGTYVRTTSIDTLVLQFLSSPSLYQKQIISLGAGSDTRFFRLRSHSQTLPPFLYHELDLPSNTSQKISIVTRSSTFQNLISGDITTSEDHTSLSSPSYNIHPLDLRTLDPTNPTPPPSLHRIDPLLPTLLISECCLIYLSPHLADAAATYFTRTLFPASTSLGLILYEPINPNTPFGRVMVSNLAARGIVLQTLKRYGSLEAQRERLRVYGLGSGRQARTVDMLWEEGVGEGEKERVAGLEMVDEVEEWKLLAGHYCVAWGWRDGVDGGVWDGWREEGEACGRGGGEDLVV